MNTLLSSLETLYPRLTNEIIFIWTYPEAISFLENILIQDREGRDGFDFNAFSEINLLIDILKENTQLSINTKTNRQHMWDTHTYYL